MRNPLRRNFVRSSDLSLEEPPDRECLTGLLTENSESSNPCMWLLLNLNPRIPSPATFCCRDRPTKDCCPAAGTRFDSRRESLSSLCRRKRETMRTRLREQNYSCRLAISQGRDTGNCHQSE